MTSDASSLDLLSALRCTLATFVDLIDRNPDRGRLVGVGVDAWAVAAMTARRLCRREITGASHTPRLALTRPPMDRVLRLVLPGPVGVRHHLAAVDGWTVRVGPAPVTLLVVDQASVILPGPPRTDGTPSVWWTSAPAVVQRAAHVINLSVLLSRPCPTKPRSRLRPDQERTVMRALVEGWTNGRLARALEVSDRTASSLTAAVAERIGARDRYHAVRLLAPFVAEVASPVPSSLNPRDAGRWEPEPSPGP